jgi:type II secretory pathway pseudopilin PulG
MTTNNQKGMTLVEVLVYIVLAAMLLAPVIMLVQNSSVTMARDASNVSMRMTGRELLNTIYDDLKNTGYKLDPADFTAKDEAIIDDADESSFLPEKTDNKFFDKLTVRIGKLDPASGVWGGVDEISYWVDDKKELKRSKETIGGTDPPKVITLARNIAALKFRYSEDMLSWYDTENLITDIDAKVDVQFIKVIIVQKDDKKLAVTNPAPAITLIDNWKSTDKLIFAPAKGDLALYERHEAVIPIPNNGLFP